MTTTQARPAISASFDDHTLAELLYDPTTGKTAFAVARAGHAPTVEDELLSPSGERLRPYSGTNNLIASGCVLLPSAIGDMRDKGELVARIRAYLHRYVDLPDEFEALAAHYILLSWVYDRFNDLPYLRFRGTYGSGKSRCLLVIGSVCYKPFFASGASTVSPIFHIQDAFQGTLVLDEADFRFSDATSELTKILNNGTTRGLPVLRTMTNRHKELNPTAFRVYGPKIVGMREGFSDLALESRFFTERMGMRPLRSDITIHLPPEFHAEALALRNDLLAWRLSHYHQVQPDLSRLCKAASARGKQMALSLLSLIDDPALRAALSERRLADDELIGGADETATETRMIRALHDAFADAMRPSVPIAEVARRFNTGAESGLEVPMNNRWVAWFVRTQLRIATMKSGGVSVVPATERAKVAALLSRCTPVDSEPGA
jgi:hypothetical protein